MDEHDSFPQRVWQIVASIPEGCVSASGWRRAKKASGGKYVTMAPGR